jgi:hypothetical protein
MEDVTLIIQGRLTQETYDFYLKTCTNFPVLISTWVDCKIDFSNLSPNFLVILSQIPEEPGAQNFHYQTVSTLTALERIKTKYVIKVRGDEFYSNLQYIHNVLRVDPDKIHSASVFFRAWQYSEYHISDHIIAGTTENLLIMFRACKYNFDTGKMNVSKWKIDGNFHKYVTTHAPEERITKSYLDAKAPDKFERVDGRILMKEYFDILDLNLLKPYKVKANLFRVEWYDNFLPEANYSISTIDQLFSDDPYKIPNQ